jgi:hypothetical protein
MLPFERLCRDAIVKLGFNRDRRRDVAVNEMVNEMFALGVFPLFGMDRECFLRQGIRIALAQLREFNFAERAQFIELAER